jgi:hypothetical protein
MWHFQCTATLILYFTNVIVPMYSLNLCLGCQGGDSIAPAALHNLWRKRHPLTSFRGE